MNKKTFLMVIVLVSLTIIVNGSQLSYVPVAQALSSDNLIGYWNFDEGSGFQTQDASPYSNTGLIYGAEWVLEGGDYHLHFTGNDRVEVNHHSSLNLDAQVTLMAWINPSQITNWMRILTKSHTSNALPYTMYGLQFDNAGHLRMELAVGGTQNAVNGMTSIPLNVWTHVASTYDGYEMKVYVNGVLDNSKSLTGLIQQNMMPLTIGASGYASNYFTGELDEVRLYNRALSEIEIESTLYPQLHSLDLNTPSELGLDILFLPEDYSLDEMDLFRETVENYYPALLSVEPFAQYRDRINIWRIDTLVDFEATRDSSIPRLIRVNYYKVKQFVSSIVDLDFDSELPNDQIIVLVNNLTYGGAAYTSRDVAVSYTGDLGIEVMTHEFGHSFGGLGDEYVRYYEDYPAGQTIQFPNIDWDGSKWQDVPGTGAYVGAWYQNLVRPTEESCIMRTLSYSGFCPVCLNALLFLLEHYSQPPIVEIDISLVSRSRCDVGSTQTISFHAVWHLSSSDIEDGLIYVNGTAFTTNATGWISFMYSSSTVMKKTWVVTGVNCQGVTDFIVIAEYPSIIWDRVSITLQSTDNRINVESSTSINWNGIYEYDSTTFSGNVFLNDTLTKTTIGKYGYTVVSIFDPNYGLSVFEANIVYCIFDKVSITLLVENDRVNVGSSADITWMAFYEYDLTEYDGYIELNDTLIRSTVGRYCYTVLNIIGDSIGITVFESNDINIIFDRIQITLATSDNRINVGDSMPLSWTGVYEYSATPFTGIITLNDTLTKFVVGKYGFTVDNINDPNYGLTVYNANEVYCIFDEVRVTLDVSENVIPSGSTADIAWTTNYQYDGTNYDGIVTLNDTVTHVETGRYGYTVESIGNDQHGISVFESNSVYIVFTGYVFEITSEDVTYLIPVDTNSTISDFSYDSTTTQIMLNISGPSGTTGVTNMTILKHLVLDGYSLEVYLDGELYPFTLTENATHYFVHFTYTHSEHHVLIDFIDVLDPLAEAGSDQTGTVMKELLFDAGESIDNDEITNYLWDFGDGTVGTGRTATHTYTLLGTYVITLTVTDAAGNRATDTLSVIVEEAPVMFQWWHLILVISLVNVIIALTYFVKKR